MSKYTMTTEAQVRAAFWQGMTPELRRAAGMTTRKRQNEYPTDIRVEWTDFVEMLARDGHISATLAQRVTL